MTDSCTSNENSMCNYCERVLQFLKMLYIQLPDDPFMLFLNIYPKEGKNCVIHHRPACEYM